MPHLPPSWTASAGRNLTWAVGGAIWKAVGVVEMPSQFADFLLCLGAPQELKNACPYLLSCLFPAPPLPFLSVSLIYLPHPLGLEGTQAPSQSELLLPCARARALAAAFTHPQHIHSLSSSVYVCGSLLSNTFLFSVGTAYLYGEGRFATCLIWLVSMP